MVDILETDHTIRHHNDDPRFNPRTTDIEWMSELSSDKIDWVVVNRDGAIFRSKAERAALRQARLSFVWLSKGWGEVSIYELAWRFFRVWPEIVAEFRIAREPTVFEVPITATKLRRHCLTRDL